MATEYKLSYTAQEIDEKLGKIDTAVLFEEQTLTDEQKAQARKNIGVTAYGESSNSDDGTLRYIDVTNNIEYVTGKYTSPDRVLYSASTLKYGIVYTDGEYDTIQLNQVRNGGNVSIWLKVDGVIVQSIKNHEDNYLYNEEIDIAGIDEVWFTTNLNITPTVTLSKKVGYTKEEIDARFENLFTEDDITDNYIEAPYFADDAIGFIDTTGNISTESSCRYSDIIKVKGGETIRITHALMTAYSCIRIFRTFGDNTYYQSPSLSSDATVEFTLPRDAVSIRYSVLASKVKDTTVSYVGDYRHFREDFIPSLYINGLESDNDYPIITFIDDDGRNAYATVVQPLLDSYGYKGTVAVITSEVGFENALTLEQLNELKLNGYEIVSHSHTHSPNIYNPTDNDGVSDEAIYNDLVASRTWIETNGFNSECLIFPFGHYGEKASKFVRQAIKAGFQFACNANSGKSNDAKVINTYWLDRVFVMNSNSLQNLKTLVDRCIENNGWLILSTHAYDESEMGDLTNLRSILAYINEKNVAVKTFGEASSIKKNICSIGYLGDKSNRLYIGRDGKIYN